MRGALLVRGGRTVLTQAGPDLLPRVLDGLVGPLVAPAVREALLGPDRAIVLSAWPGLTCSMEEVHPEKRPDATAARAAAARVIARAAAERPLLIAIDDAERASFADLRTLVTAPALVLLTTHEPEPPPVSGSVIQVEPLSPAELAEAARSMIGASGPALAWSHASDLAGNPAALTKLVHAWAAEHEPRAQAVASAHQGDIGWEEAIERAERALARYGPEEALAWLDHPDGPQPGSGPVRFRIEIVRGRAAFQQGDHERSLAHAARAGEVAPTPIDRNRARRRRGRCRSGLLPA